MANGLEKRAFQRLHVPIEVTAEIVTISEKSRGLPRTAHAEPEYFEGRNMS